MRKPDDIIKEIKAIAQDDPNAKAIISRIMRFDRDCPDCSRALEALLAILKDSQEHKRANEELSRFKQQYFVFH